MPTKEQRAMLRVHRLWWPLWYVVQDNGRGILACNRLTGEVRYVKK